MSEPPGVASALGIEAVEWVAEGGENLTVRVTGRWRRRRPAWNAQPTLVIEGPGRRYRFPAIAEPPSLSGAGPGTWRISFAVPAALAPELGGRSWLQFGAVIVPLPAAVSPPGPTDDEPPAGPPQAAAQPPAPRLPPPPVAATAPSAEAPTPPAPVFDAALAALQTELEHARAEAARLAAVLADQQHARRAAEQGARAERAIRTDVSRQLRLRSDEAERGREALAALARAQEQIRSLERELVAAQARLRQAEATIASVTAAHREAEAKLAAAARDRAPVAGQPPPAPQQRHLSLEHQLIARHPGPDRIPAEPLPFLTAPAPAAPAAPAPGLSVTASASARAMTEALRRELAGRALAEAGLRSRLIEAEARLAARQLLEQRTGTVLGQLREELDGLREDLTREREARRAADDRADRLRFDLGGARTRTREARQAIAEIRGALESLRGPVDAPGSGAEPRAAPARGDAARGASAGSGPADRRGSPAPNDPADAVQPERLNQALLRLREQIAPQEPPSGPPPAGASAPAAAASPPAAAAGPPAPGAPLVALGDVGPVTVGRPWLRSAFRALARSDPDRAGRLVLDLLPAQRAVYPRAIAYDLELGGDWGCVRVTARDDEARIVPGAAPRSPGDVEFRFIGEPAELGRRLRAGRLRRLLSRGLGRVHGRRSGLGALDALVDTQLGLGALHASGVRLQPRTALELLARLISPAWIEDERFTLAYAAPGETPVFLIVDGRRAPEVTENQPAPGAVSTITGPAGTLELVLRDDPAVADAISGDPRPVARLRDWVKHAQSG
jgi:hypothetical protein